MRRKKKTKAITEPRNNLSKNRPAKKILTVVAVFIIIGLLAGSYGLYKTILTPNVNLSFEQEEYLYIPTGADYEQVIRILNEKKLIKNSATFEFLASGMNYKKHIHPGRYEIKANMSNKDLIMMLRSGRQKPVKLVLRNHRTLKELTGIVSEKLEADSTELMELLSDSSYLQTFGLRKDEALCLFIPDTYEFYWNTSAKKFLRKVTTAYKKYWNDKRIRRAESLGLTVASATILASIVEKETSKNDEKSRISGVYLNRLKKEMKLEADPTLVYASGDFGARRILAWHRNYESPYNTYKYKGLPPGPICMPSKTTLDKVLDTETHNYMYFCARADFSGYHSFATNYSQHLENARKFHKELDKRNITR
jgi:UPF0755 protein